MSDPQGTTGEEQPFLPETGEWNDREDVPDADSRIPDEVEPETQENDPLIADLGADGQGDLAPEDEPDAGTDDPGPTDLRTEAP